MVAILYKTNTKRQYGYYIIYTNTKCDMVAILNHQTQNAIWLLYYINKHKTQYVCYIV